MEGGAALLQRMATSVIPTIAFCDRWGAAILYLLRLSGRVYLGKAASVQNILTRKAHGEKNSAGLKTTDSSFVSIFAA